MDGNYTATVVLSCLTVCILGILVHENARFEKTTKHWFYITYACIMVSSLSEWAGIALNGAPAWTMGIHSVAKCFDYIFTPITGICFALQVSNEKERRKHAWMAAVLMVNALLQILSVFTGWTFFINEENYYCHGPLYFVYTVVYCLAIVDVLIAFRAYSKNFKRQNNLSLFAIILFMCLGIGFQEFASGDVRTAYLALACCSTLLFIHYNEFLQQQNDDHLLRQKNLIETDALTGMLSRYSYNKVLSDHHDKDTMPRDLTVFSIDINGLKLVNDTRGHAAGDQIICDAAACIAEVFGREGKCYRIGGDEFIALILADRQQIEELCRALSAAVEKRDGLSLSSGFAMAAEHPQLCLEELVNVADRMMYAEKDNFYQNMKMNGHRVYGADLCE